jgi:hypothetical protein
MITHPFMLNVANLYPEWFEQLASGRKTREFRDRGGRDTLLDAVTKGEFVLFRETGGSDAAILCEVRSNRVHLLRHGRTRYAIGVRLLNRVTVRGRYGGKIPLRQGWKRVELADVDCDAEGRLAVNLRASDARRMVRLLHELQIRLPW